MRGERAGATSLGPGACASSKGHPGHATANSRRVLEVCSAGFAGGQRADSASTAHQKRRVAAQAMRGGLQAPPAPAARRRPPSLSNTDAGVTARKPTNTTRRTIWEGVKRKWLRRFGCCRSCSPRSGGTQSGRARSRSARSRCTGWPAAGSSTLAAAALQAESSRRGGGRARGDGSAAA